MPYTREQMMAGLTERQQRTNDLMGVDADLFYGEVADEIQRLSHIGMVFDSWIHRCLHSMDAPLETHLTFNPLNEVLERFRQVHESASLLLSTARDLSPLLGHSAVRELRDSDPELETSVVDFVQARSALLERLNEYKAPAPLKDFLRAMEGPVQAELPFE